MSYRSILPSSLALGFLLAGCPKGAEPAGTDTATPKAPAAATTAPKAAAGGAGVAGISPDTVVASWGDTKVTYGDFLKKKKSEFDALQRKQMQERYDTEKRALETMVIETLVEAAAQKKGQTAEQYMQALSAAGQPSDAEIQAFYDQNVKSSGQPLAAVKDRIKQYLGQKTAQDAVRKEIERLKAEANAKIDLPAPEAMKIAFDLEGRPMKGKAEAKVTIVEFSDFECPYCSRAKTGIEDLVKAYPNDVKVYFLHFPLSFHKKALPSAIAAQCANQQGKFWEFHDKAFDNQRALDESQFGAWATEIGIDATKFEACRKDPKVREFVQADMDQGTSAGVRGTPSVFINGVQYDKGVPTVEDMKAFIN